VNFAHKRQIQTVNQRINTCSRDSRQASSKVVTFVSQTTQYNQAKIHDLQEKGGARYQQKNHGRTA